MIGKNIGLELNQLGDFFSSQIEIGEKIILTGITYIQGIEIPIKIEIGKEVLGIDCELTSLVKDLI